jgi:hypothetical protein
MEIAMNNSSTNRPRGPVRPKVKAWRYLGFGKTTGYEKVARGEIPPPNVKWGDRLEGYTEDLLDDIIAANVAERV